MRRREVAASPFIQDTGVSGVRSADPETIRARYEGVLKLAVGTKLNNFGCGDSLPE
jgi:hypothetical protein